MRIKREAYRPRDMSDSSVNPTDSVTHVTRAYTRAGSTQGATCGHRCVSASRLVVCRDQSRRWCVFLWRVFHVSGWCVSQARTAARGNARELAPSKNMRTGVKQNTSVNDPPNFSTDTVSPHIHGSTSVSPSERSTLEDRGTASATQPWQLRTPCARTPCLRNRRPRRQTPRPSS